MLRTDFMGLPYDDFPSYLFVCSLVLMSSREQEASFPRHVLEPLTFLDSCLRLSGDPYLQP